jgi:hypothetical protein
VEAILGARASQGGPALHMRVPVRYVSSATQSSADATGAGAACYYSIALGGAALCQVAVHNACAIPHGRWLD